MAANQVFPCILYFYESTRSGSGSGSFSFKLSRLVFASALNSATPETCVYNFHSQIPQTPFPHVDLLCSEGNSVLNSGFPL